MGVFGGGARALERVERIMAVWRSSGMSSPPNDPRFNLAIDRRRRKEGRQLKCEGMWGLREGLTGGACGRGGARSIAREVTEGMLANLVRYCQRAPDVQVLDVMYYAHAIQIRDYRQQHNLTK